MEIWVIEDDKETFEFTTGEEIREECPGIKIKYFEYPIDAAKAIGSPAFILFDIASVAGPLTFTGSYENVYSVFRSVVDKHPGAIYIVYSYIMAWAKEVINDINKEFKGEVVAHYKDASDSYGIIHLLQQFS